LASQGNISNYLENRLVATVDTTLTTPTATYLGLYNVAPTDVGGGTFILEAGWKEIKWGAAVNGAIANSNLVDFGIASSYWGFIRGWGVFDSFGGGGNLWWFGDFNTYEEVGVGDGFQVAAGAISLAIN
jgi:hypothetical protein